MGSPAANGDSTVQGVDIHIVMVPSPGGPIPTPLPHPFSGTMSSGLVSSVLIAGAPAAVVGSVAANKPAHVATPPGTSFQSPPKDQGKVSTGSRSVTIGGQGAARAGDPVETCNDPADAPVSVIVASTSVLIG
ncbi:hypothetical protein EXU48_12760 [Occultella glacieicola]|uniref:PAAR motif protein n=1 Tax=Occultella glacieicola TaxID=2518684 RepID=A0ABY2E2N9_9MICO|nr:PAAR domain-containing protein [Occultella glacieicola]TDE92435.1 hypothetical protein EXU48_12760 [Occultella glacieicola]